MTKQMGEPTRSLLPALRGDDVGPEKGFSIAMKTGNYEQLIKRDRHQKGESSAVLRRSLLHSSFDSEPKMLFRSNTKKKLRPEVMDMKTRLKLMFLACHH